AYQAPRWRGGVSWAPLGGTPPPGQLFRTSNFPPPTPPPKCVEIVTPVISLARGAGEGKARCTPCVWPFSQLRPPLIFTVVLLPPMKLSVAVALSPAPLPARKSSPPV